MSDQIEAAQQKSPRSLVKRLAAIMFVAALLLWVIWRAWHDAAEIDWADLQISYGLFALSLLIYGLGFVWHGYVWVLMMRMLGYDLAVRPGLRASAASQFGNYIPGKVFIIVFRVQIARRYGIPAVPVTGSIALETLLRNMMATLLGAVGLYGLGAGVSYIWAGAIVIAASVIFAHPTVFHAIGDWVLQKMKRPPIPGRLTSLQVVMLLGHYFIYWAIQCFAFFLMVHSTFGVGWDALIPLSIALLASQIASTLMVVAPVGLGAAEATMAGLLQLTGGVSSPYVVALLMRVWRTAAELGQIGVVWLVPLPPPPSDDTDDDTPEVTEGEITVTPESPSA